MLAAFILALCWAFPGASSVKDGSEWYYEDWCGNGDMQFLQDANCSKLFPSNFNREWSCPIPPLDSAPSGYAADSALLDISVDTESLGSLIVDTDINLCLIMTKRVKDATTPSGVRLYNRYLCAGERSALVPYETWSSSKVFAMANAAGRLRSNETQCGAGDAHNHLFGVDGSVIGKHGVTQLGDLATVICSYDQTAGYTSNSLASYFHDLGWRQRLYDLVQDWLLVSSSSSSSSTTNASTTTDKQQKQQQQQQQEQEEESARTKEEASSLLGVRLRVQHNASSSGLKSAVQSLGGNYGESTPSDLSFDVTAASLPAVNKVAADDCQADKDPRLVTYTNTISALSAAELVRRIALHREVSPELQFPNATWHDIQTILYGAEASTLFPGQVWGGMSADIAIFTQAALDLPALLQQWDPSARSQWRIFSKLGDGIELNRGEIVSNAYACVPRFDESGDGVGGVEFTIAARGSVLGDSSLKVTEQQLMAAMATAVQYALSIA